MITPQLVLKRISLPQFQRAKAKFSIELFETELHQLRIANDSLIADIIDNDIDYVRLLELRHTFRKRILAAKDRKYDDPVAKLELYKRITKQFHNEFVSSCFIYAAHEDIATIRRAEDLIASITYRVIDLSNVHKNAFVLRMKRVRELTTIE